MINWRNGKGGFVGGLKYIIKGVFQFAHSVTSASPVGPTPDCFVGFIGAITDPVMEPCGFIGAMTDTTGLIGSVDDTGLGLIGAMTDTSGFEGCLCIDC